MEATYTMLLEVAHAHIPEVPHIHFTLGGCGAILESAVMNNLSSIDFSTHSKPFKPKHPVFSKKGDFSI